MSESTSTNISMAQTNSTDSIQALSARHSRMTDPGSTKRIYFYKSGDPQFNGIKLVVTNRSFKTFDALLDSLSRKVPLPFGVRNISTPRGMHHITSLEELEDGKSYICSHQRKIKPINLERASKKPLLWQSSRPISARRRATQLSRQSELSPFTQNNTVVIGSSKNVVIFKNGDKYSKHDLVLDRKASQSFDVVLDQVSEALQFPVFKLYNTDGRRILSTHALLLSSGTIVAAGREPFKPGNYDSDREFLPPKLPGISQRVFPKSRSKPVMKSQVKANDPVFSPNSQENSQSSANVCHKDDNLLECPHTPDNEICLTERWPHSGEELPVISPGDNIEKTVHLNSDGTMTVEMKVTFKIREEETINWSTTVSRADISYCKRKILHSSVNPETESVKARDSPISSTNTDQNDRKEHEMAYRSETHVEKVKKQIQDNIINIYKCKTSPSRKGKSNFYRPPTPGVRRGQERSISMRRASEDNLQESMKQLFSYQEMEQETAQSGDDIVNDCNTQMLTLNNIDSNRADPKRKAVCHNDAKHLSKVSEDSFELLETTLMELSQKESVYEKDFRKSLRSDFMYASGTTKQIRPHSAGKRTYHQEQFRFKEIKRSMSASVTYTEPSIIHGKTKDMIGDFGIANKECLDTEPPDNVVTLTTKISATKTDGDADFPLSLSTSRSKIENETSASSDHHHTSSLAQKKKKKKKSADDSLKHSQTSIPNCDPTSPDSQQPAYDICLNMNYESKNITFEKIFPPHLSLDHPELGTIKKLKGDKKMAKVKPNSVKIQKELLSHNEKSEEIEKLEESTEVNTACYSGDRVSNGLLQSECQPTHYSSVPNDQSPKKITKTFKRSQKTRKKQTHSKKKTKNNKATENKGASGSNGIGTENITSPMLIDILESYVQNWLNKIIPNTTLPILQMISSTRLDNNEEMGDQTYADREDIYAKENTDQAQEKKNLTEHTLSFNDPVSVLIEKSNDLAELFKDVGYSNSREKYKPEELIKLLASSLALKKPSIDAAIQVENDTPKKESTDCINHGYMEDLFKEPFTLSSENINTCNKRHLEKSMSLPNNTLKASHSSSPQLLLAWLIVLYLKQGMYHMVEDLSESSSDCSMIFNLLQSLKKIAISENADDLKAAILHVQESAVRFDTAMKIFPSDFTVNHEPPKCNGVSEESIEHVQINFINVDNTASENEQLWNNDEQCDGSSDDMDDLRFFSTLPYRELSGEYCRSEAGDCPEQCTVLQLHENQNNELTESLEKADVTNIPTSQECVLDLSQTCIGPRTPDVINGNVHNTESTDVILKSSKVKMMVQEIEQRNYTSGGPEHSKTLQSPLSSDWSDYRPDSEESISDAFRASIEILTESGEEQINEKPIKVGYVKRAIERIYGKIDSKIIPKRKVSPIQLQPKQSASGNAEQTSSKGSMSRSLSSPFTRIEDRAGSLKSASMPLLETDEDLECSVSQSGSSCNITHNSLPCNNNLVKTNLNTSGGVLIDKGRWLLKENHLVRKSPPEAAGMYGNLDTTSADTFFDNTSDDMPYMHSACKSNQPIAEISSSELEEMAKPQSYTCRYFSMPHGSDSEPFNDTFSFKSKIRPKSSSGIVKNKIHSSLDSIEKNGGKSGSLPSFATVDFHFSDNKIHPVPQSDVKTTSHVQPINSSGANQRQVQEQDSLDKIQFVCGQHCPILSAIINPINERNRGFVYRTPYDFENQLLDIISTDTALMKPLNNDLFIDENNNICNGMSPVNNSINPDTSTYFLKYKNVLGDINLPKNGSEYFRPALIWNHDNASLLFTIHQAYQFSRLDLIKNDENNNMTYNIT